MIVQGLESASAGDSQAVFDILQRAKEGRRALGFVDGEAFRLVDGAADGLPGVVVEEYAGRWLVQSADPLTESVRAALVLTGHACWWKHLDAHEKTSPIWIPGTGGLSEESAETAAQTPFLVREGGLNLEICFSSGYSQGLFLDQRDNRARVRSQVSTHMPVLNLFAYTCAFSVAAAAGGAVASSVDLSGASLEWGRRNFAHNGMAPKDHYFTKGDALEWLRVFAKKGRLFGGIILDPPTFSRAKGRKVWRVEEDFHALVAAAVPVLAPGGWMLCSTNCRRLAEWQFDEQIHVGFADNGRSCQVEWGTMPCDFTGPSYLLNGWCRDV